MSPLAIKVENLGKLYRIGQGPRYQSLREKVSGMLNAPFRALSRKPAQEPDSRRDGQLWALRNVGFELQCGELVGVIGRNGSGKSTLLKILSQITEPTEGRVELHGRVGSLLEVGTGFHPELTGRENIYLNGAILGMRRSEVARKFDEIVAFAETEKFLDTAVKYYSSGMYMRLAFAVAAHMETEILMVDEVLAVGDAAFQKKCLGKMGEVKGAGRTVLFVSHNMSAIEQLCNRVILLDQGSIKRDSVEIRPVISQYLFSGDETDKAVWTEEDNRFDNKYFRPIRLAVVDRNGSELPMPVRNDEEIWIEIHGEVKIPDPAMTLGYGLSNEDGHLVYWTFHTDQPETEWPEIRNGTLTLRSKLPARLLNEGCYRLELLASLHYRAWILMPGSNTPHVSFTIQGGLSDSPYWISQRPGIIAPLIEWKAVKAPETQSL